MSNIITYPIPSYMNADFIKTLANIDQPWGYGPSTDPNWQTVIFDETKFQDILAAVDNYDVEFLNTHKRQKSAALASLRWMKTQLFTYDNVVTQADPAMAVVLGALELRKRRNIPTEYTQTWKLNENQFRKWTETDIEAFGFAISDHIQGCFDREEELSDLIWAASSIEELEAIDITVGW